MEQKFFSKSTLEDYVKQPNEAPEELIAVSIGGKPVLSSELEDSLVVYCLEMNRRFYGIGVGLIKRLANLLAFFHATSNFKP